MVNPYDSNHMTWVAKNSDGNHPFNPKLLANGKEVKLLAASVNNEVLVSQRLTYLLKEIVSQQDIDVDFLNEIGFSKDDADQIAVVVDGLENINVPTDWQDYI